MTIPCLACGSAVVRAQAEPASTERFVCPACGEAMDVRCNYDVGLPRVTTYLGRYATSDKISPAKAFILLKRRLSSCTHFQPSQLEAHYSQNDVVWNLGDFSLSEVEGITAESARHGLDISFVEAAA